MDSNAEIARYGDLIEVTNPARVDFGKRMQVATAGDVAVTVLDNRIRVSVYHEDYKIVRRCGRPATSSSVEKAAPKATPAPAEVPAIAKPRVEPKAKPVDDAALEAAYGPVPALATEDEVAALCRAFDTVKVDEPAPAEPVSQDGKKTLTQEQIDAAVEHLRPLYGPAEPEALPSLKDITQDEFDEMTRQDDKIDAARYASTYAELAQLERQQRAKKLASVLDAAASIVDGDREKTYGNPGHNLRTIARYWSAHIAARHHVAIRLDMDDVALMMVALKLARLANDTTHRDSQIDACGYMRLLERVQTETKA